MSCAYWGLGLGAGGEDREWQRRWREHVVAPGDVPEVVVATGTVEPELRVDVKSELAGIVVELFAEEGDRVQAGDPLVALDPTRLGSERDELRAAVEVQRMLTLEDLVGPAQKRLEHARRELGRSRELARQGFAAQRQEDDARFAFDSARSERANAEHQAGARSKELERISLSLARVERDLERLVIRAPIAGVVIERPLERGSPVADVASSNGGTRVATLADDRSLHLLAAVDESDLRGVEPGVEVEVRVDALRGEVLRGTVSKLASAGRVERGVTLFDTEVALPPDARLRVGMSGDARIHVATQRGVLAVPSEAIVRAPEGPHVRRKQPQGETFELVPVAEAFGDETRTIIRSGLRAGDVVLVPRDVAAP